MPFCASTSTLPISVLADLAGAAWARAIEVPSGRAAAAIAATRICLMIETPQLSSDGARLGAVGWHSWRKDFSFLPLMVQQIGQIGKPAPNMRLRGSLPFPSGTGRTRNAAMIAVL